MSPDAVPNSVEVRLPALITLAVEHNRLTCWLASVPSASAAPARHALRKIEDFLKSCDLETRSFDNHPFDAGLAVQVVDTIDATDLPRGQVMIAETLSPMVLWNGKVVRPAEVVTRRGTK